MSDDESVDIEQELDDLLSKQQPNLQDVIKRSFTNVAVQQSKNGEQHKPEILEDTSYFSKNTQVNLSRLELVKNPSFHMQNVSLDLKSMILSFHCSLGDVALKGNYSAYNENLYNLIPVMSEGHVLITLSNVVADVKVGLIIEDDAFVYINPGINFLHDEVLVKLSWPSPQKTGGYDFVSTEQLAKHIDDLPLTACVSLPLFALLRRRVLAHLAHALRCAASVSELLGCRETLIHAFTGRLDSTSVCGAKVMDMILINVRRTLLQGRREALPLPPLHAAFLHKVGVTSYVGKLETGAGWLRSLAAVGRSAPVSVARSHPPNTNFTVTLRIDDLQLGYSEYRVKAAGLCSAGRLEARFSATLHLALAVGLAQWQPYCQLQDLTITELHGMDLHITGLGQLSTLIPRVRAWCSGAAAAAAAPLATQLQTEVHIALAQLPIWDILHGKQ